MSARVTGMTKRNDLDPVARTALVTAAQRARESAKADALFHDPFAAALAEPLGPALLTEFGGDVPVIPVRTRFFDEAVVRSVGHGRTT